MNCVINMKSVYERDSAGVGPLSDLPKRDLHVHNQLVRKPGLRFR